MIWCCALIGFARTNVYGVAIGLLFVAGFIELAFNSMAQALVQINAPGEIRGRVIGVFSMSASGLRTFSGLSVGLVGASIGIHHSLALSAATLLALFGALFAVRYRRRFLIDAGRCRAHGLRFHAPRARAGASRRSRWTRSRWGPCWFCGNEVIGEGWNCPIASARSDRPCGDHRAARRGLEGKELPSRQDDAVRDIGAVCDVHRRGPQCAGGAGGFRCLGSEGRCVRQCVRPMPRAALDASDRRVRRCVRRGLQRTAATILRGAALVQARR